MRTMKAEEIPVFFKWATQSDATPYWYGELQGDKVPTIEEFLRDWKSYYFDGSAPEKGRCFAILINKEAIGQINYNEINRKDNSVELDIIIADDENKSKGYGTDALRTLSKYLFEKMSIQTCWIEVIERNPRAIKAYKKAGFQITHKFTDTGISCFHMELRKSDQ